MSPESVLFVFKRVPAWLRILELLGIRNDQKPPTMENGVVTWPVRVGFTRWGTRRNLHAAIVEAGLRADILNAHTITISNPNDEQVRI